MKIIHQFFALILLTFMFSCVNDDNFIEEGQQEEEEVVEMSSDFSENFGAEVSRSFIGTVIDSNQNPINNVNVIVGDQTVLTDVNGVFIINDATVNEQFAYIRAEKTGFIHGSRAMIPAEGFNKVTIMLLEANTVATINSGELQTVSLDNGASIQLEGAYIREDGTAYSGTVDVIMHHLDPVDEHMALQMPGMLYAENIDGEERMLQTLGMLAVELRGASGEDLNLATGTTAEIRIPVDVTLLNNAPSTIPLWYFDEDLGYWIEDGEAILTGNEYVGRVTHFSFWNCDIPAEAINLCINLQFEDGSDASNLLVNITSEIFGTRGGTTNGIGQVCGLVPQNEVLQLDVVLQEICESLTVHTESIGPFSTDATINITISDIDPNITTETVLGTFNTCDGDPVSNGYVVLNYEDQYFIDVVSDGTYTISFVRCTDSTSFTIEGVDFDNAQTTDVINFTFTTPITNLGAISSCNTIEEFITYQVDDQIPITHVFDLVYDLGPPNIFISANNPTNDNSFGIGIPNNIPGTYTVDFIYFFDENGDFFEGQGPGVTANLTAFGNVGEFIDINFSGTFLDPITGVLRNINGTIHKIRDF